MPDNKLMYYIFPENISRFFITSIAQILPLRYSEKLMLFTMGVNPLFTLC